MEITQKGIEDLGFKFVLKNEKTGDDCTYNIPSKNKKGWFYAIVHHPSTNEVHISHHKLPPLNSIEDIYIVDKLKLTTMAELIRTLESYGILDKSCGKKLDPLNAPEAKIVRNPDVPVVDWIENKLAENLKHIVLTQDHSLMTSIFQEARKMEQERLDAIRNAFADYYASEGCSCCQNIEEHDKAKSRIGELLSVEQYEDGSGYDFYKYKTEKQP